MSRVGQAEERGKVTEQDGADREGRERDKVDERQRDAHREH